MPPLYTHINAYTHVYIYREVADKVIHLSNNESIPYGFCVWAAGVGPTSLVLDLIGSVRLLAIND